MMGEGGWMVVVVVAAVRGNVCFLKKKFSVTEVVISSTWVGLCCGGDGDGSV